MQKQKGSYMIGTVYAIEKRGKWGIKSVFDEVTFNELCVVQKRTDYANVI